MQRLQQPTWLFYCLSKIVFPWEKTVNYEQNQPLFCPKSDPKLKFVHFLSFFQEQNIFSTNNFSPTNRIGVIVQFLGNRHQFSAEAKASPHPSQISIASLSPSKKRGTPGFQCTLAIYPIKTNQIPCSVVITTGIADFGQKMRQFQEFFY